MKKISFITTCGLLLLFVVSLAYASPRKRFDPSSKTCRIFTQPTLWDGYKAFQNSCKTCHYNGNSVGAPFLYSESKVMKGWNRVFAKRYPQCAKDGKWDNIEAEQLKRLNDYLYAHAADSYDPYDAADCG